jgi:hypothetical protein
MCRQKRDRDVEENHGGEENHGEEASHGAEEENHGEEEESHGEEEESAQHGTCRRVEENEPEGSVDGTYWRIYRPYLPR